MGDRRFPWLWVGASAATALVLWPRNASAARREDARIEAKPPADGWVWPVPAIVVDGQLVEPTITDGWGSPRRTLAGRARTHRGVDIMFRVAGRPRAFVPSGTPALAAAAGRVRWAGSEPRGMSVSIDHGNGWRTYYAHLEELFVEGGRVVQAGEPIGAIGASPLDAHRVRHLHFELRRTGRSGGAIDPAPHLARWGVVWLPGAARNALRNGALSYRPVGRPGEDYPEWLRALRGQSGVYIIRERRRDGSTEIVYVGESHTGRLYETLTRHFQTWRRWKGWWRGQYGEGHDPGLTYDRSTAEVAVRVTAANDAIDEEARLIARLRPRDNLLGQPAEEEVPF